MFQQLLGAAQHFSNICGAEPGPPPTPAKVDPLRPVKPPENRSQTHEIAKFCADSSHNHFTNINYPIYAAFAPKTVKSEAATISVNISTVTGPRRRPRATCQHVANSCWKVSQLPTKTVAGKQNHIFGDPYARYTRQRVKPAQISEHWSMQQERTGRLMY